MKKFNKLTEKQMSKTNGGVVGMLVVGGLVYTGILIGGIVNQKKDKN